MMEGRQQVEASMDRLLPSADGPAATIAAAMRHAIFAGGKRLRPLLVVASYDAFSKRDERPLDRLPKGLIDAACALEMLHTYSLVHDDLPAMDDDDLRRGKPTVHRAFSESTAILAGDALHTLAFELLAREPRGEQFQAVRAEACLTLATAAGIEGMVGGQIADLEAENSSPDGERLEWIHRHKTGALLAASCEIGAIYAGVNADERSAASTFGHQLGLAFQIADDILDCTASAATLGKTPGKDAASGKATYPALYGLDGARERAVTRVDAAIAALRQVEVHSPILEQLARYVVDREM